MYPHNGYIVGQRPTMAIEYKYSSILFYRTGNDEFDFLSIIKDRIFCLGARNGDVLLVSDQQWRNSSTFPPFKFNTIRRSKNTK